VAVELSPEALWAEIEPLLPEHDPAPSIDGGQPRIDDRSAPKSIIFVLTYSILWNQLPNDLGFGSGRTCLRRLEKMVDGRRLRGTALAVADPPAAGGANRLVPAFGADSDERDRLHRGS